MNIAFSLTNLESGGAQVFVLRMADEMAAVLQKDIFIYIHQPEYMNLNLTANLNKRVKIVSYTRFPLESFLTWKINGFLKKLRFNFSYREWINSRRFDRFIEKNKISIVNSHMSYSDIVVARAKSKFRFIVTLHGEYELMRSQNVSTIGADVMEIITRAEGIIYTAQKNLVELKRYLDPASKMPIRKIDVGFSERTILIKAVSKKNIGIPEDSFVAGMVSRGIPEKGWEEGIRILEKVQTSLGDVPVYLVCIGEGNYLKELISKTTNPNIRLIQFAENYQDYFSYYDLFDVLLFPSWFRGESVPNVVIEALYWGKPVIASDIADLPLMLNTSHGLAGDLVPFAGSKPDLDIFASLLCSYYKNPALLLSKKRLAPEAFEKFKMDQIVRSYFEFMHIS
jgi:glycosyltransferase involved in cell wall biosynthesis